MFGMEKNMQGTLPVWLVHIYFGATVDVTHQCNILFRQCSRSCVKGTVTACPFTLHIGDVSWKWCLFAVLIKLSLCKQVWFIITLYLTYFFCLLSQ
jgi:hypothetical protein